MNVTGFGTTLARTKKIPTDNNESLYCLFKTDRRFYLVLDIVSVKK